MLSCIVLVVAGSINAAEVGSGKKFTAANRGEKFAEIGNPHAGSALTSGVPAPFSFPARTQPTLFTGDNAFLINVPPGATQLDVQLNTDTPGADLDLFVRFNADPDVDQQGQVIAEHFSEGLTGSESIIIDLTGWQSTTVPPQSSPTLQAGNYHIAIAVFTTDLASSGTVVATVTGGGGGTGGNLIQNGDAEAGPASPGCSGLPSIPSWTTNGNMTVCAWGTGAYPGPSDPGLPNRGSNFFGGGHSPSSSISQLIDVSSSASDIDSGNHPYTLSGYLGGFSSQSDQAALRVEFQNSSGGVLGTASVGPVLPADRGNATGLLLRSTTGSVPSGTRRILVILEATRISGATFASNDGYADDLSLELGAGGGGGGTGPVRVRITQEDNAGCPANKKIFVSVTDDQNQAIPNLAPGDFTVKENGVVKQTTIICGASGGGASPGWIAILIDASGSLSNQGLSDEKTAAKQLIDLLGPNDSVAVYSFAANVALVQSFTTDRNTAKAAIDTISRGGSTALHDAVVTASQALSFLAGRKAIVLMTDGNDSGQGATEQQAIDAANSANAPVFSVGFDAVDSAALTRISNSTGGFFSTGSSSADLLNILAQIGQMLVSQCEITYPPADPNAPATVEVSVVVFLDGQQRTGSDTKQVSACVDTRPPGGGPCPNTITGINLAGGSFSGSTFTGNGQIWDTTPSNGIWYLGVTAPSQGSPFLNSFDAQISTPPGAFYLYNEPTTFGTHVRLTINWLGRPDDVGVFQVGNLAQSSTWQRVQGSLLISLGSTGMTNLNRVQAGEGSGSPTPGGQNDGVLSLTVNCPTGGGGGGDPCPASGLTGPFVLPGGRTDDEVDGQMCQYDVGAESRQFGSAGQASVFHQVFTDPGCSWGCVSFADWLPVTECTGVRGPGGGAFTYSVDPNPGPPREGTVRVGNRCITVMQDGQAGCSYTATPNAAAQTTVPGDGDLTSARILTVDASQSDCTWTAMPRPGDNWIDIIGSGTRRGDSQVGFRVFPNGAGATGLH